MVSTTYIYGLQDPVTGEVRYVGKADRPHERLLAHWRGRYDSDTHKDRWLRGLDGPPVLVVLEECATAEWPERECHWIATLPNLTNSCVGGMGGGAPGRKWKNPGSAWNKGIPMSEAQKEKIRQAKLGVRNPEHSARMKGRELTPEHKAKIGAAGRGKPKSEAHRESIRLALVGNPKLVGRKHSEETKAKMRAAHARRKALAA